MRVIFAFIMYVSVLFSPICAEKNDQVQLLVDEGVFENSKISFANIEGASVFIDKYSLNTDEIKLIGCWGLDIYTERLERDDYGPGIVIKFLPNRLFCIVKSNVRSNRIKYVLGEWKVEHKKLMLKFVARAILRDGCIGDDVSDYYLEKDANQEYFHVFTVPNYSVAFVNDRAFTWSGIPLSIINFYGINLEDKPRYRLLFDTLGTPPGDLTNTSPLGLLLLERAEKDEYLLRMIEVW